MLGASGYRSNSWEPAMSLAWRVRYTRLNSILQYSSFRCYSHRCPESTPYVFPRLFHPPTHRPSMWITEKREHPPQRQSMLISSWPPFLRDQPTPRYADADNMTPLCLTTMTVTYKSSTARTPRSTISTASALSVRRRERMTSR